MRFLKTNTNTRITVGPFLDKTDGITPEIALTVTDCILNMTVDNAGVPTLVIEATSPTISGGNNDMVHIPNDTAGLYDLELTAAQLNYVGRAFLTITNSATHCPVFHEFTILPAVVYDSIVNGTDNLVVDLTTAGVDSVLDEVIENTLTLREALKVFFAVLGGKSSGGGTTSLIFRNHADNLNRVSATVDENGNRTAVTLNVT